MVLLQSPPAALAMILALDAFVVCGVVLRGLKAFKILGGLSIFALLEVVFFEPLI